MPRRTEHTPVLLEDFTRFLVTEPDGSYLDATFGRGGHSRAILARLSAKGRLFAMDRDPEAIAEGQRLAATDSRFSIVQAEFGMLEHVFAEHGWPLMNGIGFDLGVSSPQINSAQRGFSFLHEGPLDMRMNPESGQPLAAMLDRIDEKRLARIIREGGDERFAGRIARRILQARKRGELNTTKDLENVCFHAVPPHARHGSIHPATRTFQALRMWVNDELAQIEQGLNAAMDHLVPGGRLVVISFHSGEDRKVRDLIEARVHPCTCPPQFPQCVCGRTPSMRWVQKKPVRPDVEEITHNPRSRSARLRVAEAL